MNEATLWTVAALIHNQRCEWGVAAPECVQYRQHLEDARQILAAIPV